MPSPRTTTSIEDNSFFITAPCVRLDAQMTPQKLEFAHGPRSVSILGDAQIASCVLDQPELQRWTQSVTAVAPKLAERAEYRSKCHMNSRRDE